MGTSIYLSLGQRVLLRGGLTLKSVILIGSLVFTVLLTFNLLIFVNFPDKQNEIVKSSGDLVILSLLEKVQEALVTSNKGKLETKVNQLLKNTFFKDRGLIQISVFSQAKPLYFFSTTKEYEGKRLSSALAKMVIKAPLESSIIKPIVLNISGEAIRVIQYLYKFPVYQNGNTNEFNVFQLLYDQEMVHGDLNSLSDTFLMVSVVIMLVALCIAFFFGFSIAKPLKRLIRAIQLVSKGHYSFDLNTQRLDETGELAVEMKSLTNFLQSARVNGPDIQEAREFKRPYLAQSSANKVNDEISMATEITLLSFHLKGDAQHDLSTYQELAKPIASISQKYGGSVNQLIDDTFVCVFRSGDHVKQGILTTQNVFQKIHGNPYGVSLSAGIHSKSIHSDLDTVEDHISFNLNNASWVPRELSKRASHLETIITETSLNQTGVNLSFQSLDSIQDQDTDKKIKFYLLQRPTTKTVHKVQKDKVSGIKGAINSAVTRGHSPIHNIQKPNRGMDDLANMLEETLQEIDEE